MFDPNMAPDSDFEPAKLHHLVLGNEGRLFDFRRTPIRIVEVREATGMFVMELLAFEEKGGLWEYPFEKFLDRFQMKPESARASETAVTGFSAAIERLNQPLVKPSAIQKLPETQARIDAAQSDAAAWLNAQGISEATDLDLTQREGAAALYQDLSGWMEHRQLADIESAFATRYVSNPNSGELVKGHRLVLAELGLCPFEGTLVRDPKLFDPPWDRRRREEHIIARLGFVRALFGRSGHAEVTLYRGVATDQELRPNQNISFVSCTPSREVAEAFIKHGKIAVLTRQRVPLSRVFMTYAETAAMNLHFKETEVILFFEPGNLAF